MSLIDEIKGGESKTLEFKSELPQGNGIAKTVIAFSNTSGGKILIGVKDYGELKGIGDNDFFVLRDKIISMISDSCYPDILPEIYTQTIENKVLLVVEVYRGNLMPYYLKNEGREKGTIVRVGASNRIAGKEYLIELDRQRINSSYDEEINFEHEFERIDLSPLRKRFETIDKDLSLELLLSLKLVKSEHGKLFPTNGLLILLGMVENVEIDCALFKGHNMNVFLDKKEFHGELIGQFEQAEIFIKNHIRLIPKIKGLQRKDYYEIPEEALREAIINAVVHRDYSNLGRNIKVGVFENRLSVISPGGFPFTITEAEIKEGRSEIRNRVIARVMKALGFIEQWGSGIYRIKSTCMSVGLDEPSIREVGDSVYVEIFRNADLLFNSDVGYDPNAGFVSESLVIYDVSSTPLTQWDKNDIRYEDQPATIESPSKTVGKPSASDAKQSKTVGKPSVSDAKQSKTVEKPSKSAGKPSGTTNKSSESMVKPSENRRYAFGLFTDQEIKILKYLEDNISITSKQVEQLIGIKESRTRDLLRNMVTKGLLIKHGQSKNTVYIAADREEGE